jgi:molecular chaperone DnaK
MKYVGIDLGTTNSAICSFDGEKIHLYKSPEQARRHAIRHSLIDRRGNTGMSAQRAYNSAAKESRQRCGAVQAAHGHVARPMKLPAVNLTHDGRKNVRGRGVARHSSAILPEEIRGDSDTGTVITVPAAFNQMQKDATMAAAEMRRASGVSH